MNQRSVLLETPVAGSPPLHWPLRDGEQKLLTVGSNADWSIVGLLPVHATLYFDGARLCVAAAPGALLNGEPLGNEWRPVALPAQLSLGETEITLAPGEPEVALAVEPAEDDRLTPTEAFPGPHFGASSTLILPAPAVLPPGSAVQHSGQVEPIARGNAKLRTEPALRAAIAHRGLRVSWPKRVILLLLPVVIGLFVIKAVRQREQARLSLASAGAKASPREDGSASNAAASAANAASAAGPAAAAVPPELTRPTDDGQFAGLTLERRAVDEFATGNFREAAVLYQRLAAENPGQAAFAVAARLAEARASGVAHD